VVTGGDRGRLVFVGGPGSDVLRGRAGNDIISAVTASLIGASSAARESIGSSSIDRVPPG
jgi:Ca2+-binding RTX toxin-like protein